jgi:serine/threonine protein kinase
MSFGGKNGENISQMKNLELLRLAGNKLSTISNELWNLPNLTWLTISGNPVMQGLVKPSQVPYLSLEDLQPLNQELGKGASGQVSSYQYDDKEVAVKLIHGITSDGNANDELAVYGAVGDGTSKRIVGCIALLKETKDGKKGVVMDKLPSNLKDFALPPTIIEVTKDRWDSSSELSRQFVLNALRDVATALLYLHNTVGVAHGDVYAHNMKVDPASGRIYLLDFGASFFTGPYKNEAEKLEVRAFGVLVGELLELLVESEQDLLVKLMDLKQRCTTTQVIDRPSFDVILDEINSF